jgi:proline dehydrogenase
MKGFIVRVVLAVTRWRWVRWVFTQTRIGRRVSLRFVAGESLADAIQVAVSANEAGMPVSLNLLGENVGDEESARASFDSYVEAIARLRENEVDGNISVKLTQLGLGFDDELCEELLGDLARHASAAETTLTIDMEESSLTDATLDIYERAQQAHGNLGVALQAYLRRTPQDLARIAPLGGHIRLCKGAYDEPESIAFRSRQDVNDAYDALARALLTDEDLMPALATHDDGRVTAAMTAVDGRTAPYEFQMLYGIRVSLQEQLVGDGVPVRSYIPYGEAWYPYLTRRMAERPANLWFFVRALFGR